MRRGFTLLEMMIVVAIVGMMSALAVTSVQSLLLLGRVNGAAGEFARAMANGRTRAVGMACRTTVQINGPTYEPSGTPVGFPMNVGCAATKSCGYLYVFMKGQCDPLSSPNGYFETGDRVVSGIPLEPNFDVFVPALVLPAQKLDGDSVAFSWGFVNGALQVDVFTDTASSGTFTPIVTGGVDVSVTAQARNSPLNRTAIVPAKGPAYLQ